LKATMLAAAIAAFGFSLPAAAAQKMPPPAPPRTTTAPKSAMPAHATPVASAVDEPSPEWRVGPALGFELGLGDQDYTAPKLRIDAQRAIRRVSPETTLSFVGTFSVTHPSGKETVPVAFNPFFGGLQTAEVQWDANVFELVPAARVTYVAGPKLNLFADGGLGLVYTAARTYLPPIAGLQSSELVGSGVGGVLRLAAGLEFTPSPGFRVAIQAIGLDIRFGKGPGSAFDMVASVSHRL